MEPHKFRRPAALGAQAAEAIVGADDPADRSELAHESAWALLGVGGEGLDDDARRRLVQAVREDGVDVVAGLWDRSPAFTLPGALWRIYLLWQWSQINPALVEQRFAEGAATMAAPPRHSLGDTLLAIGAVMDGRATEDDLPAVLEAAAQAMRIMADGVTYGALWITEDGTLLSHPVTRRPLALLATAAELEKSALQARHSRLN